MAIHFLAPLAAPAKAILGGIGGVLGSVLTNKAEEALTEDKRAALMDDMAKMDDRLRSRLEAYKAQAEAGAIPRRHGSMSRITENKFVILLTKIRSDEDGERYEKLEDLVNLSEDNFWQTMNALNHDPVEQYFHLLEAYGTETANRALYLLGISYEATRHSASIIDIRAERAGNRLHRWLDGKGAD